MPLDTLIESVHQTLRLTDAAVHVQALASPSESAYLQGYPLQEVLASAQGPTQLATPDPPRPAPPPSGTTQDVGMAPSPLVISPGPGPLESQPSQQEDTTDGDDGPSTGLVVGSAVAIVAALVICVAVAIYVLALRRRMRRAKASILEQVRACGRGRAHMSLVPRPPCQYVSTDSGRPTQHTSVFHNFLYCHPEFSRTETVWGVSWGLVAPPTQCGSVVTLAHACE